jgi:hypothetical protein
MNLPRRLLSGVLVVLLLAEPICAQDASTKPAGDLPPPLDLSDQPPATPRSPQATKQAPKSHGSQADWTVRCKPDDWPCNGLIGFGAGWMWTKIRRCWQPPMRFPNRTVISTAVRFGEDGRSVPPPDRTKTIISLVFELNPNGTLMGRPRANPAEPSAATQDMIEGAIAAVVQCQPYDSLPSNRYERWRQVFVRIGIEYKSVTPERANPDDPSHKDIDPSAPTKRAPIHGGPRALAPMAPPAVLLSKLA